MRKFKKLIPAFCMLLVSAVMLGSTTYAWFSMNNKVTATGMQVTAKSNTEYLIISDSNAVVTSTTPLTSVTALAAARTGKSDALSDLEVYPVAYNNTAAALTLYDAGKSGDERTVSVPANGWYTAHSTEYDKVGSSTSTTETTLTNIQLVTDSLVNYVLEYNVWISVAAKSADITGKVDVTGTFTSADDSVCALVTVGDGDVTQNYYFGKGAKTDAITVNGTTDFTFTNAAPVKVTVRLFIDGTSDNVKSNTTATLSGALSLDFAMAA